MSTAPADRARAETAVTELYRLIGEPRPRFVWVPSPAAALPVVLDGRRGFRPSRLRAGSAPAHGADWPVAARLASLVSDLQARLDARIDRPRSAWARDPTGLQAARTMAPEDSLRAGASLHAILESAVREPLEASLRDALRAPMRSAMLPTAEDALGLTWYGQHDEARGRTGVAAA